MKKISLQNTLPKVFTHESNLSSEIWQCNLEFLKGKFYLIEAASGTGKSSLCSFLYGIRSDYQGNIFFDSQKVETFSTQQWTELRQHTLSILFQDLKLFDELTAFENVWLKNQLTHFKSKEEILLLFDEMDIADKLNIRTDKLSYGQQQRVAFIRSLCQPFDFILLDEPVSHLDENNAQRMSQRLTQEAHQQEAGILVTSIGKRLPLNYDQILQL